MFFKGKSAKLALQVLSKLYTLPSPFCFSCHLGKEHKAPEAQCP